MSFDSNQGLPARSQAFLQQTHCFKELVLVADPNAKFYMIESPPDDGSNWFITWYPGDWKRPQSNWGVHWELTCPARGGKPSDILRLSLGAEAPLLAEHKSTFKDFVAHRARSEAALGNAPGESAHFVLFPDTWGQAKIARGPEIPLLPEGGQRSFDLYASAAGLNAIVREAIDEFTRLARFDPPLR